MREVTYNEYVDFLARHRTVAVGRSEIRLLGHQRPKLLQPQDFKTETITLWSFPQRGRWAPHRASYRGNWAPQIARNLILRYSKEGDTVLDQMVGGGTTLVECKLTGRNAIGVDVNRDALMLTLGRLNFSGTLAEPLPPADVTLYQGDARNLDAIPDASIDLIATHPPYANIIRYSRPSPKGNSNTPSPVAGEGQGEGSGDLSHVRSIAQFVEQMSLIHMGKVAF